MKDDEIRNMAGHPDAIPVEYIEWFLKGWRACETNAMRSNQCNCEYCDPTGINVQLNKEIEL